MRLKRILYPLICIAVVFAIATFLIVKNKFNYNSTAQSETSVKTGNSDSKKNNDNTNNDDDGIQTLIEDQEGSPTCDNAQDQSETGDKTPDTDDDGDKSDEEDNTTGGGASEAPTNPTADEPTADDSTIEPDNPISPVDDSLKIVLSDCSSDTIIVNTDILCLNYEIVDGNKQYINQDVNIIIENENVCDIMLQGAPLIYLQKQGKGKTTVKIVSATNPQVFKIITVVFN